MNQGEIPDKQVDILIIDDDPSIRKLVETILAPYYTALEIEPNSETMNAIISHKPSVIILDINMPGEDGISLLSKIKDQSPASITIMLTRHGDKNTAIKCLKLGAFDYLQKPCNHQELIAAVDRAVNEFKLRSDLESSHKLAAIGEMSAGIVHEIVDPLATICSRARHIKLQLKKEGKESPMLLKMADVVEEEAQRVNKIIEGLRSFSRHGLNDPFLNENLSELVSKTLNFYNSKIKFSDISVFVDVPDHLKLECHGSQLQQVLLNMLNNACDAIKHLDEKWIKIEAKESDDLIEVFVTDSGSGIPDAIIDKLFQPFYTTKAVGEGTGLGMSIIKGIVESHQGKLSIDKTHKNTRFIISLPKKQSLNKPESIKVS